MKMRTKNVLLLGFFFIFLINYVNAQNIDQSRQDRIDFGYVLNVKNISTEPPYIPPGVAGKLKVVLENRANFPLYDIRAEVNLSDQILFLNDVSKRKIFRIDSGHTVEIEYDIIALPTAQESVYKSQLNTTYLNHIGTEREELYNFGIAIKAEPKLFAQVENTELTTNNNVGITTIKLINNDIGNIKFLTVELLESPDYDILSPNKQYIGDLDSDDFDSIDFKLTLNTNKEDINLPLRVSYKDTLNQEYTKDLNVELTLPTPEEAGSSNSWFGWLSIIGIIIILLIVFYFYRRYKSKKIKQQRY